MRQEQRQKQRMVITYMLRQSLEILQMPKLELAEWLHQEIEKNPLMEWRNPPNNNPIWIDVPHKETLREHLLHQIQESFASQEEQQLATQLLELLDEKGFLPSDTPNSAILSVLQTFTPRGIFARNCREVLLLQLSPEGFPYRLIRDHFPLTRNKLSALRKKYGQTLEKALHALARLSLRPASCYENIVNGPITVDLAIKKIHNGWSIELIDEDLPQFYVSDCYNDIAYKNSEEKEQMRLFKTQSQGIMRSLERRRKMLLAIGRILLRKQASFLEHNQSMRAITIKDIATELDMHESTISRAIAHKYVATPKGIVPLRSLMAHSEKTEVAKALLLQLINNETTPLSDLELSKKLQSFGHSIARRTIAKYRKQSQIKTANFRKKGWL